MDEKKERETSLAAYGLTAYGEIRDLQRAKLPDTMCVLNGWAISTGLFPGGGTATAGGTSPYFESARANERERARAVRYDTISIGD